MKGAARARRPSNKRRGRVAPAELARLLDHPESLHAAGWTPDDIKHERKRLGRLKARYFGSIVFSTPAGPGDPAPAVRYQGGICNSHRWADDVWEAQTPYPPGGPQTRMVLCIGCGAFVPPIYLGSSGHCADCRYESNPAASDRMQRSSSLIDHHQLREDRRRN